MTRNRQSLRLQGYDYSQPGAYFITLNAYKGAPIFGDVIRERVVLSGIGDIVDEEWFRSAEIREEIELNHDEFIIRTYANQGETETMCE